MGMEQAATYYSYYIFLSTFLCESRAVSNPIPHLILLGKQVHPSQCFSHMPSIH